MHGYVYLEYLRFPGGKYDLNESPNALGKVK